MALYTVRVEEVPRGAVAAWAPVPILTPMGAGGGSSNAKAGGPRVLRAQDPPNAIPGGPLNPMSQGSVAYDASVGQVYGGGLSYIIANVPQAFQWKQRQEVCPPFEAANAIGTTPQVQQAPHVGGRNVTGSPFVVQRWGVYGS